MLISEANILSSLRFDRGKTVNSSLKIRTTFSRSFDSAMSASLKLFSNSRLFVRFLPEKRETRPATLSSFSFLVCEPLILLDFISKLVISKIYS